MKIELNFHITTLQSSTFIIHLNIADYTNDFMKFFPVLCARTHAHAQSFGIITSHFREYACAAHECVCQLNFTNKQMNQNTFSIYRIHTFKTKNFVVILSFLRLLIATLYYDVSCAHKKIHTYSKHFSPCVDSVQIDVVVVMTLVLVVDQRFETCFPLAIWLYL